MDESTAPETIAQHFQQCSLVPQGTEVSERKNFSVSAVYIDSAGRSKIRLPLKLQCGTESSLDALVGCVHPDPRCSVAEAEITKTNSVEEIASDELANIVAEHSESKSSVIKNLTIEAKVTLTFGNGEAISARVENISVLSTSIEDVTNILFDTEIMIAVSREGGDGSANGGSRGNKQQPPLSSGTIKTNLEVRAVYKEHIDMNDNESALEALNMFRSGHSGTRDTVLMLSPVKVSVELSHAMLICVQSAPGPSVGHTFISIEMKHPNTHNHSIEVASISLHASHTRQANDKSTTSSNNTRQPILDMSSQVFWGYTPLTDPKLPRTINPNESYSTILTVRATEDIMSRDCFCPLSMSANINVGRNNEPSQSQLVTLATKAYWSTSRAIIEPADSFRVDMKLSTSDEADVNENVTSVTVGTPLNVHLDIANLSTDTRQVMLIVDQDSASGAVTSTTSNPSSPLLPEKQSSNSRKTAVVAVDKDGTKFGVWGLNQPTHRNDRDANLLPMDSFLLLGEMKGQTSTKASLRVFPLREGALEIPNFKLIDNRTGKRYTCCHRLQTVVTKV